VLLTGFAVFLALYAAASVTRDGVWRLAGLIEFPVVFAVAVLIKKRARCPVCNERLNYIDFGNRKAGRKPQIGLDQCKGCGLHLEAEIPASNAKPK